MLLKLANLILTLFFLIAISVFSWLFFDNWQQTWHWEAQRLKVQQEEKQELIQLNNSIRELEGKIDSLLPKKKNLLLKIK